VVDIDPGLDWVLLDSNIGLEEYIFGILQAIIGLGGIFAACILVYGAYVFILSGGDPENAAKGQKIITNALIGLILAAISFMVINFVIDMLGDDEMPQDEMLVSIVKEDC